MHCFILLHRPKKTLALFLNSSEITSSLLNFNSMLYTLISIFALAAILGMVLISHVLRDKETPKGVVIGHGLFAAIALVLLLVYVFENKPGPVESAVLFVIAALGGFIMLSRDLSGKKIPKWLAVVHGLLAVTGFIFLLLFTFNK
jgi:hypothetical protein